MGVAVLGQYIGNRMMAVLAQDTVFIIRKELSKKIVNLPLNYYDSHSHGEIMSTFTNDIDALTQSLEQSVSQVILSSVTFLGTFAVMIFISWELALLVLFFLGIMALAMRFITSRSRRYYRARQAMTADLNGFVEEMVTAQKVIKLFNHEGKAIEDFDEKTEDLRVASTRASTFGVVTMPLLGNLSYVMYATIAIFGSFRVIQGRLSIGNISAFLQYTRNITRPIAQVSQQLNSIFSAVAGAERIFEILDVVEEDMEGDVRLETKDGSCYWKLPLEDGKFDLVPVAGDVRFKDVDFGYVPEKLVLKDISLFAKPGQKIAFVGSTGAGKTTITNLINRFYDINDGEILIDGINVKRINKYDLRSIMSMVLQDVELFSGTIADNIRYGRLDATDEDVIQAAKTANAHGFITRMEEGYDTYITNLSSGLSQGERQLISIARAAIADPVILIMDEATSSIDTRTERLISKGMDAIMKDRTNFVIAHRLSTVRDANAIMVLENGEIVERGDHDELMAMKGRYYDLNVGAAELS